MVMLMSENYSLEYHDHPNMLAFTKIIEGEMTLSQFDLVEKEEFYTKPKVINRSLKGKNFSKVKFEKDSIAELSPYQNNIHAMKSLKRCVVVDVLFNYYNVLKSGYKYCFKST